MKNETMSEIMIYTVTLHQAVFNTMVRSTLSAAEQMGWDLDNSRGPDGWTVSLNTNRYYAVYSATQNTLRIGYNGIDRILYRRSVSLTSGSVAKIINGWV